MTSGTERPAAALAVMVVAYVQPFMAPDVVHALHQVRGISGATFTNVRGFGRGRLGDEPDAEMIAGTADKIRVEVVVPASLEDVVVRSIRDAAHTGGRGDGKVFVLPVSRAVRVATGEEGSPAV